MVLQYVDQSVDAYMYSEAAGMIEIDVTGDLSRRAQNVSLLKVVAYSPLAKQASMSATFAICSMNKLAHK